MLFLVILLLALAIYVLTSVLLPLIEDLRKNWQAEKERDIGKKLDNMFSYERSPAELVQLYYILPPVFALAAWAIFKANIALVIGAAVGLSIPGIVLNIREKRRRKKFEIQILDAIMLLSSCLKGGLSLLQAFEVLVEEMPAPMSQEMGLVIRENKMGITLEESLRRLNKRMYTEELTLVVNSILVARETGGDLTKVFSRLCTSIRDNRKLKDSIRTLTLQGRLQGIVMSVIPIFFFMWVMMFNKEHFSIMFQTDLGKMLLIIAVALQLIGMVLIHKFSKIKI